MISLNLLPDIKKEYLRSQRIKRFFIMSSILVSAVAIASVLMMSAYVLGVQRLQIANSQRSIDASIKIIAETEDLAKIVTIRNQLEALPQLHESKNVVTRLFSFIEILTPDSIYLSEVVVDFEDSTFELRGTGDDFKAINTYVDTLKNASFVYAGNEDAMLAFNSVVLDAISIDDEISRFKIVFSYEPTIFSNRVEDLRLTVPNIISTQSEAERPKTLFRELPLGEDQAL